MNKRGFTLIELLAVIVIMGIIMAIAIPEVTGYIAKAKRDSFNSAIDLFIGNITLVNETSLRKDKPNGTYTITDGVIVEKNNFSFDKKLSFDGTFALDNGNMSYTFYNSDGLCVSKNKTSEKKKFGTYINSKCNYEDNIYLFVFDQDTKTILRYIPYDYELNKDICVDFIVNDYFYSEYLGSDLNKVKSLCNEEEVLMGNGDLSFTSNINYFIFYWSNIDYLEDQKFLKILSENSKDVNIPNKINGVDVLNVGEYAFSSIGLTSVMIPNSVISIGDSAFYDNYLTNIVIPNSVKNIGYWAFANNNLTNVIIPNSVTSIGGAAFNNNALSNQQAFISLASNPDLLISYGGLNRDNVIIPNSFTSIGDYAFSGENLTSITIPNSVISIGDYAFSSNNLASITISNSVTSIGDSAFFENELTSVTIPNSITSIEHAVFYYNNLESITIPNSVTSIGDSAFFDNKLTSLEIPNSVTNIDSLAFSNNNLTNVTIPSSVITIKESAFRNNNLTNITIPSSVTNIGYAAFANNNLTNATILSSITIIGDYAFHKTMSSNYNLNSIIYKGTNPQNWNSIVNGNNGTSFITGIVSCAYGNVTISAN